MQLVQGNLTQLRTGCLSEILLVQKGELELVLKSVESKATKQVCHLMNEWNVMSQLQHPNIVSVLRCLQKVTIPGKEGIYFILAQEYAKHGNLSQLVRKKLSVMSVPNRRFLFWELVQAIDHLHSNNVVHRDLKLDNVLVFQNQQGLTLKLADFGFAKILTESGEMVGSYKGTKRGYMAPEIHECKEDNTKRYDGKAADMFALGVILFALVMGRLPFQFAIPEDRNYKLLMGDDPSQFWATLTPLLVKLQQTEGALVTEFKDLFVNLVKYNPKQRLKIGEVMQHEWLLGKREQMSV